jgi:hypothetical protein
LQTFKHPLCKTVQNNQHLADIIDVGLQGILLAIRLAFPVWLYRPAVAGMGDVKK